VAEKGTVEITVDARDAQAKITDAAASIAAEMNTHDYETSLLRWAVVEPINGGTDWNVIAAFPDEADAEQYAEWQNQTFRFPDDARLKVRDIGTHYKPGNV